MPASSRLPSLGAKGEGWVAIQAILLALVVASAFTGVYWPDSVASTLTVVGLILIVGGIVLLVAAGVSLVVARAATVLPHPREGSSVAQGGVYRFVRHPVYGAVLLLAFGASFAESPLGLVAAVLLALVFDLKARLEEAWLTERRPEYAGYCEQTQHRFVPGLY
jgi:protein-S-isoprenylcysteine O-methyltransferase Ste14